MKQNLLNHIDSFNVMKSFYKKVKLLLPLLLIVLLISRTNVCAQTTHTSIVGQDASDNPDCNIYDDANNYWDNPGCWSNGVVPSATDNVIVDDHVLVLTLETINNVNVVDGGNIAVGSGLTINGKAVVEDSGSLIVGSGVTINDSLLLEGTVSLISFFAQPILTLNGHAVLRGNGSLQGNTSGSGTINCNGNVVIEDNAAVFNPNRANLTIQGTLTINDGIFEDAASTGTNNYNGAVTINGGTFNMRAGKHNFNSTTTLNGGNLNDNSNNGINTFVGLLTINSGGTFSTTANSAFNFRNGINNSGTFTKAGTGTVTFESNTQTITANSPININAGAVTFAANTTLAGSSAIRFNTTDNITINNNISVTNTNTDSVRIVGVLNGGGANAQWINQGVLAYENAAAPMATGIFTATAPGNTVKYTSSAAQTVRNTTYNNLVLANTGNKTLPTTFTVNNNLDIRGSAAMVVPASANITVNGGLRFFNTATMTAPAGSITMNVNNLIYGTTAATPFATSGTSTFNVTNFTQESGTIDLADNNTGVTTINVSGNFTQTGGTITETATAPSAASTVNFNGSAMQQISQSGATIVRGSVSNTNYPRFVFNNSNGFTLNTDVEVPAITLTNGRVTTGSNTLNVYETDASAIIGGNNASHINGKIGRRVATTSTLNLEMPVGKAGNCRPILLQVTQANATPTYYVAEQFESTARNIFNTLPDSVVWVSDVRYFRVQKSTGVGVDARITLRYAIDDVIAEKTGITICKSNASYTAWDKIRNLTTDADGCVPTGLGEWDCEILSDVFNTFSDFTLGSSNTNNLLPVRLLYFAGKINNSDVLLDWKTASESNSSHFIVERSTNGKDFREVGRVAASGNSNSPKSYQLLDAGAAAKKVPRLYYRLRQVDLDGTQEFSRLVVVILAPSESLTADAYPNPFDEQVSINISVQGVENAQVEVTDITGKTITKQIIGLSNGSYNGLLNMPTQLSAGVYLMKVVADGQVKTVKIIKK